MRKIIQKYDDVVQSLFFTFLFGFAAHGYRFLHTAFSHDSLLIYQDEAAVQTALGRFLQPVYWQLRGHICAPFLIGVLSLLFLGLAVSLLGRALEVRTWYGRMLICGLTAVNAPFTLTSATYIPWLDIFMLSFFFCTVSIWVFRRYRYGFLLGAVPIVLAMGLYQSFFQAAAALYMILAIKCILDGKEPAEVFRTGIRALCTLGLGMAGYYIVYKLVLQIGNIPPTDTYNGLSGAGDFSGYSVPKLVGETYRMFFRAFLHPETVHVTLTRMIHIALLLMSCGGVAWLCRKKIKPLNLLMLVGVVLLFPFGANLAYFISKGSGHTLMEFSFSMVYVLVVMVIERCADAMVLKPGWMRVKTGLQWVTGVLLLAVVFHNTVFANQAYLKKDLNYEATMSAMTRLIDRMEQTDGYEIGQTPVVILGTFDDLGIMSGRPGYERQTGLGFYTNSAITYEITYALYFQNVLGYPVNLLSGSEKERYAALSEVQEMPAYPERESCRMIGGVLVVKLA